MKGEGEEGAGEEGSNRTRSTLYLSQPGLHCLWQQEV